MIEPHTFQHSYATQSGLGECWSRGVLRGVCDKMGQASRVPFYCTDYSVISPPGVEFQLLARFILISQICPVISTIITPWFGLVRLVWWSVEFYLRDLPSDFGFSSLAQSWRSKSWT